MEKKSLNLSDYTVGWLCALGEEASAARWMLDKKHDFPKVRPTDTNSYTYGEINGHNVAIAQIPTGQTGKSGAARMTVQFSQSFQSIRIFLFVGIGGGVPINPYIKPELKDNEFIHLGDVVVGSPKWAGVPAIIEYDRGRCTTDGHVATSLIDQPIPQLIGVVDTIERNDEDGEPPFHRHLAMLAPERLEKYGVKTESLRNRFQYPGSEFDILCTPESVHPKNEDTCTNSPQVLRPKRNSDKPVFHRGPIASGDLVMQNGKERDRLSAECHKAIRFETEAAGVMIDTHSLVIRGISDYADSHKPYRWHNYAAATAAAFARQVLEELAPRNLEGVRARPLSVQSGPGNILTPVSSNSMISPIPEVPDTSDPMLNRVEAPPGAFQHQRGGVAGRSGGYAGPSAPMNYEESIVHPRAESAWGIAAPLTPLGDNNLLLERLHIRDDKC
ncbi:nucleoside phosphorylase domain-containing protein [Rhexocercosporidium sp. MPI-PUGE-AT-0058]|nr:nucleoside phosphorylase domain-containing protein [Rhexocercosporidium sp. MPI-PUGE-AT-0058]